MADTPEVTAAKNAATEADASAKVAAAQAAAATTSAQQAAAQTGIGQTDVASGYRSAGSETISDVGQAEAYLLNMKRVVANENNLDAYLNSLALGLITRVAHNAESFDQSLKATFLQITNNMVALANAQNNDSHDINNRIKINAGNHDQRVQVIAEEGISENPIFQDAVSAAVVKALEKAGIKVTA
jgi:hypothetical protein